MNLTRAWVSVAHARRFAVLGAVEWSGSSPDASSTSAIVGLQSVLNLQRREQLHVSAPDIV
jgi:hypothetical protein